MTYTPIMYCGAVANREKDDTYQNRWFLVDANNQSVLATTAKLAEVEVEVKFGYLAIRAPEMLRLDIAMDVIEDDEDAFEQVVCEGETCRAVSEGDLAAQWFSVYLGQEIRLMKKV